MSYWFAVHFQDILLEAGGSSAALFSVKMVQIIFRSVISS